MNSLNSNTREKPQKVKNTVNRSVSLYPAQAAWVRAWEKEFQKGFTELCRAFIHQNVREKNKILRRAMRQRERAPWGTPPPPPKQ